MGASAPFVYHHMHRYQLIKFSGGEFMKNSILVLTEQRQSDTPILINSLVQSAITAWLTKELRK